MCFCTFLSLKVCARLGYFWFLFILQATNEYSKQLIKKYKIWKSKQNQKKIKEIFARIEILNEERELEVIYFKIPSDVIKFWESNIIKAYRKELIYHVKRDNAEEKVRKA